MGREKSDSRGEQRVFANEFGQFSLVYLPEVSIQGRGRRMDFFSLTRLGSRDARSRRLRSRRRDHVWRGVLGSRYGWVPQDPRARQTLGSPRRRPSPSPHPPRPLHHLARAGHRRRATSQCPLGLCGRTRQSPRTDDSPRRAGGCARCDGSASWGGLWGESTAIPSRRERRRRGEEKALAGREKRREREG
jgi:hypothetical protein